MSVEILASAVAIVGTIVTTTVVVVGKLTHVEVLLAELRATMAGYEHRISELERKSRNEQR